jgi:hypothetical protein
MAQKGIKKIKKSPIETPNKNDNPIEAPKKDDIPVEDVQQIIIQVLDKIWPEESQTCPICKRNEWHVMDKIFESYETNALRKKSFSSYPVLTLMCHTCGYTLNFNYIRIKEILKEQNKGLGEKNGS